ncbi:MAG: UDP-glucose 4-epimerase GalE [Clostridiales bacterium]|jgi:UDP-glucose 4-epimerase|nr:UDP-glucose 4-epimerase GalE [Clostridiales bacterium]
MSAVLVCGGAGYVGSHTAAELVERGYEIVVVDNLEKGHRDAVWPGARFYQGDLRDEEFMTSVFEKHRINSVVHFAAYSLVSESVESPVKYYENNVCGALTLLKAMMKANVYHIVFSSTAAAYGEPQSVPILESAPTLPINPYGETKLAVEKMFKWFDKAYGLKYAVLRYFNVAGAHPSGRIGEDHRPETHLIPTVLQTALGKIPKLKLFGDDYPTTDGTCVRDYIHATDLADAHILALEKLLKHNASMTYNLGNGKGFSNKEIVETAKAVTGKSIPVEIAPRRPGDPPELVASSEKIIRELGWRPRYNTLEQIIGTAWEWHSKHPDGYES